jgi:outer membrane protein TolC
MKAHLYGLLCEVALFMVVTAGFAQEIPASTNLTLAGAVDLAVSENPELRSLRAKWEALLERPAQESALPNPMLKYGSMDSASDGRWPDSDEKRIMVEQSFPWFGKRGLREGIARKDAEATQWELESMTRDVVMRVKESYFDLYAVQQVIAITRKEESVLHRMSKITETMYATGERTQQDVLKARSEITLLKQRLLELGAQENALQSKLNALLNRRADAPLGAAVTPPRTDFSGTFEALFAVAATNRPEVRAEEKRIERYELEKKLMDKESMPDYQLGLEYRDISDGENMVMLTVGVELPIRRTKYRAAVHEAEKMRISSEAAREAAQRNSALDVQDASFKLRTARRMLELYTAELIPQAETRFKASEADYQTGKADFMDFLESQRFLLTIRVMAAMAEGNIGIQFARLERAVGMELKAEPNPGENRK